MNKIRPISPSEVIELKSKTLPEEVIFSFNTLIIKNFSAGRAILKQDEITDEIIENFRQKGQFISARDVLECHYLDVEEIYRKEGWIVEYDKPGCNENYEPTFIFKKEK